jgi:hypothetical protein
MTSIYRRYKSFLDFDHGYLKAKDANQGPATTAKHIHHASEDWASHRKANPANVLLPGTVSWADSLPPKIRPVALMAQYPRIANLLALAWNDPKSWSACINDLLTDRRGSRQGFPKDVLDNLFDLLDHRAS